MILLENGEALLLESGDPFLLEGEDAPDPEPSVHASGAIPATRPTYRDRRRPRPKLSSTGKWRHGRGR